MTPVLAGLGAAASALVALLAIPMLRDRGPIDRLEQGRDRDRETEGSALRRLFLWLTTRLGPRITPRIRASKRESIDRRLDLAGRPGGVTVQRFVGYKAAAAVILGGPFLLLALLGSSPLLVVLTAGFGWFAPDVWVSRAGRLRQERIERDLPDFLDILAVTVRAGLGYRLSLARVAESLGGPVGEEMLVALRQMELGASRRAAFEALRERNASEQLTSFVTAQLQAEELGVPLSEALNDIAIDMRRMANQQARRRAQRASPRVSLLVTTLIVPGSMILILLSIYFSMQGSEGSLFGG
jgi:tight adherence protein C